MSDAVIAAGVEFRSGPEADQVAAIANVEVRAASSHLGYPAPEDTNGNGSNLR